MSNKSGLWNAGFGEIGATLKSLEDAGATVDHLALLRSDAELAKQMVAVLKAAEPQDIQSVWQRIYKKYFNRKVDFSQLTIPAAYDPKKHFCVIVVKGMKMNEVVKGLRKHFTVSLYFEDLDGDVTDNDRVADKDYAILFHKNVEADEEYKNTSANTLKEQNHQGITLLERLLLEAYYFETTKKHLDIKNWNLCSGSRYSDGRVPGVYWRSVNSELHVDWNLSSSASDNLRSRVVVSL